MLEVIKVTGNFKLSVWYSSQQEELVSMLLKSVEIPVLLNAQENFQEGITTDRPSDLVFVFGKISIAMLLKDTFWDLNTRFLVISQFFDEVETDFKIFWTFKVINAFEIVWPRNEIIIYNFLPYANEHCDLEIFDVDKFSTHTKKFDNDCFALKNNKKFKNLHQCNVNTTFVKLKPIVITDMDKNVTKNIQGIEGKLLMEYAKKLNFNVTFATSADGIGWGWIKPSPSGAVGEVFMGKSDFAMGLLAPTSERYQFLDISVPYGGKECITYSVPKGAGVNIPYWLTILIFEFTPITWSLIFVTFIFIFYTFYQLNKYLKIKLFSKGSDIFFYEFSSCLGLPVKIPHYEFFKIAVLTWILFSFIITVAYKSSISSKLTVPQDDPEIQSFEELIRSPLQLTGYNNMYRLLEYNESEPTIKKMAQKFQITDYNIDKAVTYISTERKIAYMGHTSMFLYYSLINPVAKGNIHVMTDCILSYYPSIMLKKHSPFLIQLDVIINRLKESGITSKWRSEYIFSIPPPPRTFLKLSNDHIYGVFCILFGGYILSFSIFITEIIVYYAKK